MTGEYLKRVAQRKQIPWRKVVVKARKTAVGLGAVGLGIAIAVWLIPPLSPWCVYPLLVYGGYCIAGDLVRGFGEWLPAALRDLAEGLRAIRDAIKGSGK